MVDETPLKNNRQIRSSKKRGGTNEKCVETDNAALKYCDVQKILEIVKRDGMKLQYVSDTHKDRLQVVLEAVKQNGMALQYASDRLKNDQTVVLAAIKQNGMAMQFNAIFKSKDYALIAIETNASAIKYANAGAKNTYAVVIKAVKKDGLTLEYASDNLRAHREIVLEAVKQNGLALQYASEQLRKDREVIEEAVKNNPNASRYAFRIPNRPILNYIPTFFTKKKTQAPSTRRSRTSLTLRDITFSDFFDNEVIGGMVITFIIIPILLYHTSIVHLYGIIKGILHKLSAYSLGFAGIFLPYINKIKSMILSCIISSEVVTFSFLGFINKYLYYMMCNDGLKRSGMPILYCSGSQLVDILFNKSLQIIWYFCKLMFLFVTNRDEFYTLLKSTKFVDLKTLYIFFQSVYRFTWGLFYSVYSLLPPVSMKLPPLFNSSSQHVEFDEKGKQPRRFVYKDKDKYIVLPSENPPKDMSARYLYIQYTDDAEILYSPNGNVIEKNPIQKSNGDVWEYTNTRYTFIRFQRKTINKEKGVYRDEFELRTPKEDLSFMQYIVSFLEYFHKDDQKIEKEHFTDEHISQLSASTHPV